MFKTLVRTFCDHKVALGKTINRATVLDVLKQQKRLSKLTYAEIAKKLNKSEVNQVKLSWCFDHKKISNYSEIFRAIWLNSLSAICVPQSDTNNCLNANNTTH